VRVNNKLARGYDAGLTASYRRRRQLLRLERQGCIAEPADRDGAGGGAGQGDRRAHLRAAADPALVRRAKGTPATGKNI